MNELAGTCVAGDRELARHRRRYCQIIRRERRGGGRARPGQRGVAAVVAHIDSAGGTAMGAVAELTRYAEIETLRESVEKRFGPVDILVANAGGSPVAPAPLEEISEEAWRQSIDGNLTATFSTLKAFLPGMKERHRGVIITMSSAAARRATPRSPMAYAAAKAGIELLTKEVAAQAGPHGVSRAWERPPTLPSRLCSSPQMRPHGSSGSQSTWPADLSSFDLESLFRSGAGEGAGEGQADRHRGAGARAHGAPVRMGSGRRVVCALDAVRVGW